MQFYFDIISHNAWLAYDALPGLAREAQRDIEPVPVVFGALLKANGQLGPAEIPAKSRWMIRDVLRKAARRGLSINPPHSHPFNPLLALRLCCVPLPAEESWKLIGELFRAAWVDAADMNDAAALGVRLATAGFDAQKLLAFAGSDDARSLLRANTDAALANGVFGVPSVRVDDALFWGYDDLPVLRQFLAGADPLASLDLTDWERVRPSVSRRR